MRADLRAPFNHKSQIANQKRFVMQATIGKALTKIFGSRNERLLKRYRRIVEQVNELEPKVRGMTDEQLRARTVELHDGLVARPGRPATLKVENIQAEAFAMIRESMD